MSEKSENWFTENWWVIPVILGVLYFVIKNDRDDGEPFNLVKGIPDTPKGWVRQKSPTSSCTIACPKSWPKGESGLMGAVWVSQPYGDDGYVALRRIKRSKPSFDLSACSIPEFTSIAIPLASTMIGLSVDRLEHDFEMDGKEAVWGRYTATTVLGNRVYGFSAVTWSEGILYMLHMEHTKRSAVSSRYNELIKVARLVDLK